MANKTLFTKAKSDLVVNNAGGQAYNVDAKLALVKYLSTGTFSNGYYTDGQVEVEKIVAILNQIQDSTFIAKAAIWGAKEGRKDVPAFCLAYLMSRSSAFSYKEMVKIFNAICRNGRMVRNFVQIMRSGQIMGRKSLGTLPKRLVQQWLNKREDFDLFKDSVGNSPSIADVIKLSHPKPQSRTQDALFKYLISGKVNEDLHEDIQQYEQWNKGLTDDLPDVPFQMLTHKKLTTENWRTIAESMSYNTLRMNLNTIHRHVPMDAGFTTFICDRLTDPDSIEKSKVLPYQLYSAYKYADNISQRIKGALRIATDISSSNVPRLPNSECLVLLDISVSMSSSVNGVRTAGDTSKISNIEVASLITSSFAKTNKDFDLVVFNGSAKSVTLSKNSSILENAQVLSKLLSGGTNTGAAIKYINDKNYKNKNVIIISDNHSWIRSMYGVYGVEKTAATIEWDKYAKRVNGAKLVCLDISPNLTVQVPEQDNVLNVAGWTDSIWEVIQNFYENGKNLNQFVEKIERVAI